MDQMRVVIVGGGFGGFSVAKKLLRSVIADDVAITILDPLSSSVYTPWLYEVATGSLLESSMRGDLIRATDIPMDRIANIRFRKSSMQSIHAKTRHVVCSDGSTLAYDICVLAMGSVTNDFGIPGVRQFAMDLKTTSDALMIRTELSSIISGASQSSKRIVIAGAGANGVEFAAECAIAIRSMEEESAIPRRSVEVMLVDAAEDPLKMLSPLLRQKTRNRLRDLGIVLRTNTILAKVDQRSVGLKVVREGIPSESIETVLCDFCITALGVRMPEIVNSLPFAKHPKGRIFVEGGMHVLGHRDIFALGDIAAFTYNKDLLDPQTAQVAVAQADIVVKNIVAMLTEKPLGEYRQKQRWDILIALGGKYAIGNIFGIPVWGYTAYILRRCVDARYFFSVLPWRDALLRVMKGVIIYGKNETAKTD